MVSDRDDQVNQIPMKSLNKNNDENTQHDDHVDVEAMGEEQIKEKRNANILIFMKKLTIALICFIGIGLITYVVFNLIFNDWNIPDNGTENTIFKDFTPSLESNFSSELGIYKKAAVCSDKLICSEIGSSLMNEGGSAVDAAIGTLLCNGILTQQSMGIGGGMYMNIYIAEEKKAYAIDAREVAPFAAETSMFGGDALSSLNTGLAIAVPGELKGYHEAHQRFGKLTWKKIVEPSIKLCEDGFYITQHIHLALIDRMNIIKTNDLFRNIYLNSTTGKMLPVGTKVKPQKQICDTYKLIAENGPNDFYNGTLADLVLADLKDVGSIINSYDLKAYTADMVKSLTMPLGEYILHTPPPVSSGIVVGNILSILQGYNFSKWDIRDHENLALTIHRFVEAMKFGYAKRWELGDMKFNDVSEVINKLINIDSAAALRKRINDSYILGGPTAYDAHFSGEDDHGTSHAVVLAPNGDAVSVTSSINDYFGSTKVGKRTGIVFNSGMNDFSIDNQINIFNLPPAPSNYIKPHKRPMSSMAPIILTTQDGNVHMAVGAAGGSKIIAAVVEVVARVLWFENNIKEAIDAPRFYHQLVPEKLQYDEGMLPTEVIEILKTKGQIVSSSNKIGSVACGLVKNETGIFANADFRKRGGTAGF